MPPTNWLVPDTDVDRVIDSAECTLASDPTSAASKPPAIVAPDADSDGLPDALDPNDANQDSDADGLKDGLEFRGYGSNPANANTDGDPGDDGCEALSLNGDTKINSGDQCCCYRSTCVCPHRRSSRTTTLTKTARSTPATNCCSSSASAPVRRSAATRSTNGS